MWAEIRMNDTLKLKKWDWFTKWEIILWKEYNFEIKGRRLYNMYPSRVFLVEEINEK